VKLSLNLFVELCAGKGSQTPLAEFGGQQNLSYSRVEDHPKSAV
jgi:hypothetical protein